MTAEQLKNSILQMAVQGKLVPQDPNDEPASELIKRIREEKEKLIKEGKIKKEKNPSYIFRGEDNIPYEKVGKNEPVSIADEVPFEIPESWEWVRLKNVGITQTGNTPSKLHPEYFGNDLPFIGPGNIQNGTIDYYDKGLSFDGESFGRTVIPNSILQVCIGGSIGKAAITEQKVAFNQQINSVTPIEIKTKYLFYCISSPYIIKLMHEQAGGTATPIINRGLWDEFLLPIPPLAEQERIISVFDSINPYINKYYEVQTQLDILNNSFSDVLKKSILQEAVMGKLVPQDENDEPASVLLERIRKEKQRLIAEGKLKKDKHESIIYRRDNSHYEKLDGVERCIDDEIPFEIPDSWEWERWGNLSDSIQYGYNASAKATGRIKMVRISDIQDNKVTWNTVPYCDITEEDIETYLLEPNDILFARTGGTVGKSYLVTEVPEEAIYAGYLIRTRYNANLCPQYLKYFMESPLYWEQLKAGTTATAQPNCNGQTLGRMLIPIPPRAEQKRIVETLRCVSKKLLAYKSERIFCKGRYAHKITNQ
jgi:type I restriction enzyme S subunit